MGQHTDMTTATLHIGWRGDGSDTDMSHRAEVEVDEALAKQARDHSVDARSYCDGDSFMVWGEAREGDEPRHVVIEVRGETAKVERFLPRAARLLLDLPDCEGDCWPGDDRTVRAVVTDADDWGEPPKCDVRGDLHTPAPVPPVPEEGSPHQALREAAQSLRDLLYDASDDRLDEEERSEREHVLLDAAWRVLEVRA